MRWSKLKQMIEEQMADSLAGRVEVYATRYPKAHDGDVLGRGWITIDKQEVANFCDHTYLVRHSAVQTELRTLNQEKTSIGAHHEADEVLDQQGIFARWDYLQALRAYLSLSIDDALKSDNPLIRGIAMTDKRLGKRRLRGMQIGEWEHGLIQLLYRVRCEAEGIRPTIAVSHR